MVIPSTNLSNEFNGGQVFQGKTTGNMTDNLVEGDN